MSTIFMKDQLGTRNKKLGTRKPDVAIAESRFIGKPKTDKTYGL